MKNFNIVREVDCGGDPVTNMIIRRKIGEWAASVPNHPYSNLSELIEYKALWYRPSYSIKLKTLYNSRELTKKVTPHSGAAVPVQKFFGKGDIDLWSFNLQVSNGFGNEVHTFSIPESQSVEECSKCGAVGSITCPDCGGAKKVSCSKCGGVGEWRCESCSGKGSSVCRDCYNGVTRYTKVIPNGEYAYSEYKDGKEVRFFRDKNVSVEEKCPMCKGTGRLVCANCGGDGNMVCKVCGGKGKVLCKRCAAQGSIVCPVCSGKRYLLTCFYILNKDHSAFDGQIISNSVVYDMFPEYRSRMESLPRKVVYSDTLPGFSLELVPARSFLDKHIQGLIDKASSKVGDNFRISKQMLEIELVDAWVLDYSLSGKAYTMLFAGKDMEVVPGVSPISEASQGYVDSADDLLKSKRYVEARNYFQMASEIDSFELREVVEKGLSECSARIRGSYNLGAIVGTVVASAALLPFCWYYYNNVNYVFGYASFMKNPDFFLYRHHPWAMIIFSALFLYSAYTATMETTIKQINLFAIGPDNLLNKTIYRSITAALIAISMAILLQATLILLNATGFNLILTFMVWIFTFWL
ncbi:MAG: hypothetical protein CVU13_10245 [Bacteroidetes bacterium HGW-Bacteroidetes-8]|jgi:hypothetical protein|nr:MAG: hypothetical protein CVU13_10245 [Bacteroidetes bacterium HGW-Bacteroidetes-8]